MDINQTTIDNNTDIEDKKRIKYLKNRVHINNYLNKKYATDEAFREKRKAYNLEKSKKRYLEDPAFREELKRNVRNYRERQKAKKQASVEDTKTNTNTNTITAKSN